MTTGGLGLGRGLGIGSGLGLGLNKQQQQPPQPQFQITEQMLIGDLPVEAWNEFINVFQKVNESPNENVLEGVSAIDTEINGLEDDTTKALLGTLMSLAHQIDYGKSIIKEYKDELEKSKDDLSNSSHVRVVPTPFIIRYVNKIQQRATDLSESLAAYESRLQPTDSSDSQKTMYELLNKQHEAVLRCSSRVSRLREKLDKVRTQISQKVKSDSTMMSISEGTNDIDNRGLVSADISTSFSQFQAEQKKKIEKRNANSDLFGNSNVQAPAKTGFGLGSGLGLGGGLNLNKSSTLGSNTANKPLARTQSTVG